ncbi:Transcriptional regulator, GntR family domain / Aspartate aminotransferase [hydrothermal vent metagenome]|uniref:Transcriptional regulator, GntR family domain / Aspartate aminotransferase n=1 Tax=hydrothermal vent metagenome TaxID=652676 RepID=A0A3B0TU92_9ZZZZ
MGAIGAENLRKAGQLPLKIDRELAENLQIQIFRGIQYLIVSGRLKSGVVLPSFREMAAQLGVSKNTVILAYERLICEGYLVTRPGVGTFVSPHLPEQALRISQRMLSQQEKEGLLARRHPLLFHGGLHGIFPRVHPVPDIDFAVGRPDAKTFPARIWKRLLDQKIEHGQKGMTQYHDPAGLSDLRQAIADHLGPARGINATPGQIIITGGIQEALNLIARLLVASETRVAIESPCYQGAAYVFKSARAAITPVPVDADGLIVERLPADPVSLIYVTPSHQYPLGGTLSLKRRFELLEWAWNSGAYIVEDDYDSDFRYHGSPLFALAGLDRHDSVIYLGTFSKSIGSGIRTGYIVAPPALVEPLTTLKGLLNNGNPWLEQAVLAEFIASGAFDRHMRRMRLIYLERQNALIKALKHHFGAADITGSDCGMHLVWTLPPATMSARKLADMARLEGVGIYPLELGATSFVADERQRHRMVMLGFTSLSEDAIRKGVRILARIIMLHAANKNSADARFVRLVE